MKIGEQGKKILNIKDFFSQPKKIEKKYYDFYLVVAVILLLGMGMVMLYSTSARYAQMYFNDDLFYLKRQFHQNIIFILIAGIISFIDYHVLVKGIPVVYLLSILTMFLARTPLGINENSVYWMELGAWRIQPSEFVKMAVVVAIAYLLINMGKLQKTLKGCLIISGIGIIPAVLVCILTGEFSTALIIVGITAGILFITHPDIRVSLIITTIVLMIAAIFVACALNMTGYMGNRRFQMIYAWRDPQSYANGAGHQINQSLIGLCRGGIFGKGLGNSIQTGAHPKEVGNMMLSIVCEELGYVGAIILIGLLIFFLYRLYYIARYAPDITGNILVSGIFVHVAVQIILSFCVAVNLIPAIDVSLPLISYNDATGVFVMIEIGIALSVARGFHFQETEVLL